MAPKYDSPRLQTDNVKEKLTTTYFKLTTSE